MKTSAAAPRPHCTSQPGDPVPEPLLAASGRPDGLPLAASAGALAIWVEQTLTLPPAGGALETLQSQLSTLAGAAPALPFCTLEGAVALLTGSNYCFLRVL